MTIHIKNGSIDTSISRRGFVSRRGRHDLRLHARRLSAAAARRSAPTQPTKFNALCQHRRRQHHHHRLPGRRNGAGRATSLPLILAEELDADWSKVKVRIRAGQSEALRQLRIELFNGAQITAASVAVPGYFMPLRMAGAQARKVLLDAVADEWKVPVAN